MPLSSDFWENEHRQLLALLLPRLTQMALAGMFNAARQAGIAFDNTLYNQRAEAWARTYTDQLMADLGSTTETAIGGTIADWIARPGATIGELNDALEPACSPERANVIAITETTRAFASGQEEAYKAEGINEWTWKTNRDELVCKYCGGANGKTVKIGDSFGSDRKGIPVIKPPFHPNCRCWVSPAVNSKKDRGAGINPVNVAMAADVMDVPRALGADVSKHFALQAERINELAQKSVEEIRIQ